jgi:hypothetical protein
MATRHAYLAVAIAGTQVTGLVPGLAPRAFAGGAGHQRRQLQIDGVTEHRLLQGQGEFITQIGATKHRRATTPASAAEDVAEHVAEDVAEGIAGIETGTAAAAAGLRIESRHARTGRRSRASAGPRGLRRPP